MRCTPVRYMLMRHTPVRCTFMRYTFMRSTPVRYTPMKGFCEDLARQNIAAHLSQLQLGFGVVTYGSRLATYGLRAVTWVTCCHI